MRPGLPVTSGCYFHEGVRTKPAELNEKKSSVHDFWKWAFSMVNENTTRGILAQYIVAWAIGDERNLYDSWQSYDSVTPSGKRIEVKATASAQIWEYGKENRKPRFEITEKAYYTHEAGLDWTNIDFHANIYVLCHYKHEDDDTMDATNLSHLEFWVLTKEQLLVNFAVKFIGKAEGKKKRRKIRATIKELRKLQPALDARKLKDTILSL